MPEAARSRTCCPFIVEANRPEIAQIRQWFSDLDDPDASVREQARVSLMGMQRRDLPAFQKLVDDSRPLAGAGGGAAATGDARLPVRRAVRDHRPQGFLGVRMQDTERPPARPGPAPTAATAAVGVVIVERMPGFVGARCCSTAT